MEWGPLVVIALRLIIPLSILRWPLAGGLLCMVMDAVDVVLITALNRGEFSSYHTTDKMLDVYYLSFEAFVSLRWKNTLARKTSIILFIYRIIGFVLFETLKIRAILFIFPNLFENFYIFYLAWLKIFKKDPVTSRKNLTIILIVLLIPKLAQEYLLHVMEAQPWKWIRFNILGMSR